MITNYCTAISEFKQTYKKKTTCYEYFGSNKFLSKVALEMDNFFMTIQVEIYTCQKKLSNIKRNALFWPVTKKMVVISFEHLGLKGQN
jgi:hypothetical protein